MAAKDKPKTYNVGHIARNRRASFDYELSGHVEAGLELIGSEVKSLRIGSCDLTDAWVNVERGEAWLMNLNIPELKGAAYAHEAKRKRKLLLHAKQIDELDRGIGRDGMTATAVSIYFNKRGRVKVEIALARGKKKHDQRQSIKAREADREARSAMRR